MTTARALMQQTQRRLLRHRQLNVIGFFLPLIALCWIMGRLMAEIFALLQLFALLPPLICCGLLGMALWRTRAAVKPEAVAALIDARVDGKERFLTIATASQHSEDELYGIIQRQADQLSSAFHPIHDLPFTLDRRILFACGAAVIGFTVFFLLPLSAPFPSSSPDLAQPQSQDDVAQILEAAARRLTAPTATPQEQRAGVQLLALAQQMKDPSLSPQEKQRLIEEALKRWNLDLPLPQLLPFDLKIFASKGKDNTGQGTENDTPQGQGGESPLSKTNQNLEQFKKPLSSAAGSEPQQGSQQNGEKKEQSPPRQNGGGITFNLPQPQAQNREQSPQDASSSGQKSSQLQTPDNRTPGTDPNRPGEGQNNQAQKQNKQGADLNQPGERPDKNKEEGAGIGQGKGERFLKPGDQPGGGFLTQDARFVKVRVPLGQEAQGEGSARTGNASRATPKTPYSNVPLKEGSPDHVQSKQPIPLEYRSILSE
ncbi:MAG TPA: hypothetical protein VNN62_26115 [Methylomirabilota bacterium]|nr:hypothetical protein [Methylomirabilota bacterium]